MPIAGPGLPVRRRAAELYERLRGRPPTQRTPVDIEQLRPVRRLGRTA